MASRIDELKECLAKIFKPEIQISYREATGPTEMLVVYAGPLTLFFSIPCLEAPECDIEFYAKAQILSAIRMYGYEGGGKLRSGTAREREAQGIPTEIRLEDVIRWWP
jgi:hypothetical protein